MGEFAYTRKAVHTSDRIVMRHLAITLFLCACIVRARYTPDWTSIDSRPLPQWYDEAKVGIFLHWGLFSVPSWCSTTESSCRFWWYWKLKKNQAFIDFMAHNYPSHFTYADFAAQFKAELYNASQWADLFKEAGAK